MMNGRGGCADGYCSSGRFNRDLMGYWIYGVPFTTGDPMCSPTGDVGGITPYPLAPSDTVYGPNSAGCCIPGQQGNLPVPGPFVSYSPGSASATGTACPALIPPIPP
jgi:hypothetical protein